MYGKLKKGKGYEDKGLVYVPFEKCPLTASLAMHPLKNIPLSTHPQAGPRRLLPEPA